MLDTNKETQAQFDFFKPANDNQITTNDNQITTIVISMSGGRTSGFMGKWMIDNKEIVAKHYGIPLNLLKYIFVFANTGMEAEESLEFMRDTSDNFNMDCVWLEGVANHGKKIKTGFRQTSFEKAYRIEQYKDVKHPMHDYIIKYGQPNQSYMSCTRELKQNTIVSYLESIGLSEQEVYTAIGIRTDEATRCSDSAHKRNLIYPLVDIRPTNEPEILTWWKQYEWDLKIERHMGNCVMCYEKCSISLNKVYNEMPLAIEIMHYFEDRYAYQGPEFEKYDDAIPRATYRGKEYANQMIARFKMLNEDKEQRNINSIDEHYKVIADEKALVRKQLNQILKQNNAVNSIKTNKPATIKAAWIYENIIKITTDTPNDLASKAAAAHKTASIDTVQFEKSINEFKTWFDENNLKAEILTSQLVEVELPGAKNLPKYQEKIKNRKGLLSLTA